MVESSNSESSHSSTPSNSQSSPTASHSSNATVPLVGELPYVNDTTTLHVDCTNTDHQAAGAHPMEIKSEVGILKPRIYIVSALDNQEPTSHTEALAHKK